MSHRRKEPVHVDSSDDVGVGLRRGPATDRRVNQKQLHAFPGAKQAYLSFKDAQRRADFDGSLAIVFCVVDIRADSCKCRFRRNWRWDGQSFYF